MINTSACEDYAHMMAAKHAKENTESAQHIQPQNAIARDCNVEMVGGGDADILGDDYEIGCK